MLDWLNELSEWCMGSVYCLNVSFQEGHFGEHWWTDDSDWFIHGYSNREAYSQGLEMPDWDIYSWVECGDPRNMLKKGWSWSELNWKITSVLENCWETQSRIGPLTLFCKLILLGQFFPKLFQNTNVVITKQQFLNFKHSKNPQRGSLNVLISVTYLQKVFLRWTGGDLPNLCG